MRFTVAENSIVEKGAEIGNDTVIWYFSHVRKNAKVGAECSVGDHCFIDEGVIVGNNVRIGNGVSLYKGNIVKDNVRIGPNATFTNVRNPRTDIKGKIKYTIIEENVYIGAGAKIVCGITIGKDSRVAEGAVVYYNVPQGSFVSAPRAQMKYSLKVNRVPTYE